MSNTSSQSTSQNMAVTAYIMELEQARDTGVISELNITAGSFLFRTNVSFNLASGETVRGYGGTFERTLSSAVDSLRKRRQDRRLTT